MAPTSWPETRWTDPDRLAEDRDRVQRELAEGERSLWSGRPSPAPKPIPGVVVWAVIVDTALLLAGGIFLSMTAAVDQINATLGALITLEIAFFLSTGLIIYAFVRRRDRSRRRGTFYALTDRRAIVWRPHGPAGGVEVLNLSWSEGRGVGRVEYPDGSGDLRFLPADGEMLGFPAFERIDEVAWVERLAREAIRTSPRTDVPLA